MKRLLLFLFLLGCVWAQELSDTSDFRYYPLETGNYFEYYYYYYEMSYFYETYAYSVTVLGDTTLENDKIYKILYYKDIPSNGSSGYYEFQRVDSSDGSVYKYDAYENSEYKLDSLFAQAGDTIRSSRSGEHPDSSVFTVCNGEYTGNILGVETKIREYITWDLNTFSYKLAMGFGYIYGSTCEFSCGEYRLAYAEIGGEKYGSRISYKNLTSAQEGFKYYPIDTGNYFEYMGQNYEYPLYSYTTAYSVTVLGDTTLPNGETYKTLLNRYILPEAWEYYSFERIDSTDGSVYIYVGEVDDSLENNERKIDSLFVCAGDYVNCSRSGILSFDTLSTLCRETSTDTILGVKTNIKKFVDQSGIPSLSYELAQGFGEVYSSLYEFGGGYSRLVYAEIDGEKYGTPITGVEDNDDNSEKTFDYSLSQNYPNPFNPTTKISFEIAERGMVDLTVYDIKGARVQTLTKKEYSPGIYSISFNGAHLSSGVYFYRIITTDYINTKKMLLLK